MTGTVNGNGLIEIENTAGQKENEHGTNQKTKIEYVGRILVH